MATAAVFLAGVALTPATGVPADWAFASSGGPTSTDEPFAGSSDQTIELPAGGEEGEPSALEPDRPQDGPAAITLANMTQICVTQHGDPSATAEVRPSGDIPAHWIKCISAEGENLGGIDLDTHCAETRPRHLLVQPDSRCSTRMGAVAMPIA
jgi:hypothetical protein